MKNDLLKRSTDGAIQNQKHFTWVEERKAFSMFLSEKPQTFKDSHSRGMILLQCEHEHTWNRIFSEIDFWVVE